MAKVLFILSLISLLLFTARVSTSDNGENGNLSQTPISFYLHDLVGGSDPSAVEVARSATRNPTNFGTIKVMDDLLTTTADRNSAVIGKAQGLYISVDRTISRLFTAMTITFSAGPYAGSSFSVVGRNTLRAPEREMPITGGTGLLHYAKGYVVIRTHFFDETIGYAVMEYNCYFNTSPYNVSSAAE